MTHYKDQLLACDFFTVESLFLQTIYVFFFIEIGRRTVHFAGYTTSPTTHGLLNKLAISSGNLMNKTRLCAF
jgi:hypothetical protein